MGRRRDELACLLFLWSVYSAVSKNQTSAKFTPRRASGIAGVLSRRSTIVLQGVAIGFLSLRIVLTTVGFLIKIRLLNQLVRFVQTDHNENSVLELPRDAETRGGSSAIGDPRAGSP